MRVLCHTCVKDEDKEGMIELARRLHGMGFRLHATKGTARVLREKGGIEVEPCYRSAARMSPDALDLMRKGMIQLVINTPRSTGGAVLDGNMMRRLAVELNIPFVTTMAGARMEVEAIAEMQTGTPEPRLLEIATLK